jgi:hypothetical protein
LNLIAKMQQEGMRRAMLEILQDAGAPLSALMVRTVMDQLNHPTTWEGFLGCIEYLACEGLLGVYPVTHPTGELMIFEQEKYLRVLRQTSYDSLEARQVMLRIRQLGRRFLEGNEPSVKGVALT